MCGHCYGETTTRTGVCGNTIIVCKGCENKVSVEIVEAEVAEYVNALMLREVKKEIRDLGEQTLSRENSDDRAAEREYSFILRRE